MTQEEKARAYDEALERARKQRDEYQEEFDKTDKNSKLASILRAAISAVELAFPELAESEDERIRKALIWHLKAGEDFVSNGVTKAECLAYLEKQKEEEGYEAIPVESTLEYKLGFKAGKDSEKQKEQKPSIFPPGLGEVHWNPIPSAKKGLMEKPAEPSGKPSRQEYLYHLLANGVITFSDYEFLMRNKGRKPADLSEMMVHKEPYIAPVPTPMVADEQKPAEWSEEEKRKLNRIYSIIGWAMDEHAFSSCKKLLGDKEGIELQDFLRSIAKPKQEWSEEDEANRAFILESLEDQIRFCKKDAKGAYYTKQIQTAQNWLKSLSLNLKKKNDDVAKLCSNEWSEEDEKIITALTKALIGSDSAEKIMLFDGVTIEMVSNWLKSLRPQPKKGYSDEDEDRISDVLWCIEQSRKVAKNENDMGTCWSAERFVKSLRPQQRQEWSEEEKEILDSILSHYVLIDKPTDANGISKEKYISLIKSLRFDIYKNCNSHWKPSEEQMKALYDACCISFEEERDFHPSLSRLYHDLRKL